MMSRKDWKRSHKRFGRNKIKRQKCKLHEGKIMQRVPLLGYKKRRDCK
jgi:hypothetical protein